MQKLVIDNAHADTLRDNRF